MNEKTQKEKMKNILPKDVLPPRDILPHRYPFLLVDRILAFRKGFVRGRKCVSYNEPFFQGHFPQEPVMPGVLIVEALAQLMAYFWESDPTLLGVSYLVRLNNFVFKKKVVPGDILILEANLVRLRPKKYVTSSVAAFVDDEQCVQGELSMVYSEEDNSL